MKCSRNTQSWPFSPMSRLAMMPRWPQNSHAPGLTLLFLNTPVSASGSNDIWCVSWLHVLAILEHERLKPSGPITSLTWCPLRAFSRFLPFCDAVGDATTISLHLQTLGGKVMWPQSHSRLAWSKGTFTFPGVTCKFAANKSGLWDDHFESLWKVTSFTTPI